MAAVIRCCMLRECVSNWAATRRVADRGVLVKQPVAAWERPARAEDPNPDEYLYAETERRLSSVIHLHQDARDGLLPVIF